MSLRRGRSSESGSKCRAGLDGRVSRGKPLTSSVLQGPAKPGGQGTSKGSKSGASLDNGSTSSDEFPFSPPSQLSTKPEGRDNAKRCQSTRTVSLCISSEDEQELSGDKGTLDDRDLAPLYSCGQLTSTIIACYQHLLKGKYNAIGGPEDPAYGLEYDFSTQRGFFVQVLHVNGDHWIVASNMNCKPGHIRVFDSIHDDISTDTINQICCIVRSKRSKIKIDIMDVCKQKGTNDCGLYALANATVLCEGELPQLKNYVQEDMRPHLQECLKNCTPYPFPSNHRDRHHDDIKKTKLVSLHCTCWLPEHLNKRMIQCINCEVWYHDDCEVVEPKAWKDEDYPWKCRKCINRSESS